MPSASPIKWHLAHTTWFFETFVLEPFSDGWRSPCPEFREIYNSYYNAVGRPFPRPMRGVLTRPGLDAIRAYRDAVDEAVLGLLDSGDRVDEIVPLVELGLHHEQQHQELILSDLKHLLSCSPLSPVYIDEPETRRRPSDREEASRSVAFGGGVRRVGHAGEGFCYDNEAPAHEALVHPFRLADRLVTNGQWQGFIEDGGYETPSLWLDAGWSFVEAHGIRAPLYWRQTRRRVARVHAARRAAPACDRARGPCLVLRGGGVRPLVRREAANRVRVGGRRGGGARRQRDGERGGRSGQFAGAGSVPHDARGRARGRDATPGRCLGVDPQRLCSVPEVSARPGAPSASTTASS
jgi:ergothioneine biosynthesis protein EgtB